MRAKVIFGAMGIAVMLLLLMWFVPREMAGSTAKAQAPRAVERTEASPQAPPAQEGSEKIVATSTGIADAPRQDGTGDRRTIRFTTSVTPVYEGGAQGPPIPFTVEVRADGPFTDDLLQLMAAELPERVKGQLHAALLRQIRLRRSGASVEERLDTILERLETMEQRLKAIEKKSTAMPPVERKQP